jgi:plastocyanin
MKRIFMVVACTLAACEGEPPKVPAGAPPVTASEPAPVAPPPEAPAANVAPAAPAAAAAGGPCCNCCPQGDGGAPAADGAASAVVATAPAPAEGAKANITGTVTSTPAALAANAVVFLVDAPIEPTAKMTATVDNLQMTFMPYVAVIPVGGRIFFHNSDPFPHNVFSPDNEKFNLGNISQGTSASRVFKAAGHYTVLCNLHPGMIGYVVASPSSYFAKANAKGQYTIKNVPAGTYKVAAWAPRQEQLEQSATVGGADVTLDFQLHR